MVQSMGPGCLAVLRCEWSDHAVLSHRVPWSSSAPGAVDTLVPHLPDAADVEAEMSINRPTWFRDCPELDELAKEAVENASQTEVLSREVYGPVLETGRSCSYYIAVAAVASGQCDPVYKFAIASPYGAVYWSGPVTEVDVTTEVMALLYAVIVVARMVPVGDALIVYTASEELAYWMCAGIFREVERGFHGPLGRLLRCWMLDASKRRAPMVVHCTKGRAGQSRIVAAAELAAVAAVGPWRMPKPLAGSSTHSDELFLQGVLKVSTTVDTVPVGLAVRQAERKRARRVYGTISENEARGRRATSLVRAIQSRNLNNLMLARTSKEWWAVVKAFTSQKSRSSPVSAAAMAASFYRRLNPPPVVPAHFDQENLRRVNVRAGSIPSATTDATSGLFFSKPFQLEEVDKVKKRLRTRLSSAVGCDGVGYRTVCRIPSAVLVALFNRCIEMQSAPKNWLTTTLIGILKSGKPKDSPESYRLIGLESCLLKALTMLVEARLREWADSASVLPPSQNGFRPTYRTNNNAFILRALIERARAQGKSLIVVYVDLTNAFPATNMPALWCKLQAAGVAGPLFDWLRMLYQRMRYSVRHEGEVTDAFKSFIGLLTGDPVSPILWDIFFADLDNVLVVLPADVVLAGRPVSHGEQADDVFLATTEVPAAQQKLNVIVRWCVKNFATMSVVKTEYMIFGPLPLRQLSLFVNERRLSMVKSARYVGVFFSSVDRDIFAENYRQKAKMARSKTRVMFAISQFTGDVAPVVARRLYMAQVDPHLIGGCEVVLDVNAAHLLELERVQREFWRRALGLSARCSLFLLFTETGVMPLRFRRLLVALRYLQHLTLLDRDRTARLAQIDFFDLDRSGYASWAGDIRFVLEHLPSPVLVPSWSDDDLARPEWHATVQEQVTLACDEYLRAECLKSKKTWILQRRLLARRADGKDSPVRAFREYLNVPKAEHRVALTRLICSDHDLAVEVLRRGDGQHRKRIPREWRLCRFCVTEVETEAHALLGCKENTALVGLRESFWLDVETWHPALWRNLRVGGYHGEDDDTLLVLLEWTALHQRLARFVFDVFALFAEVPVFVPEQRLFESFPDLEDEVPDV